jgi:hypothetical protein
VRASKPRPVALASARYFVRIGNSFLWAEGGCPALLVRTARERASVCANIELAITNLRTRERVLSIRRVIAVLQNLPEDDQEALLIVSKLSEEAARKY